MTEQTKISWQALEFRHYEKNIGWYVTLLAIAILVTGFFIIQSDYFAGVTTAILAIMIIFFSRQKPELMEVEITGKAVHMDNLIYPFKHIKHFWIVNTPHHKTLNLETTTLVNRMVIIELGEQDAEEVREFLLNHLPEHTETTETITQKIMHKLKF